MIAARLIDVLLVLLLLVYLGRGLAQRIPPQPQRDPRDHRRRRRGLLRGAGRRRAHPLPRVAPHHLHRALRRPAHRRARRRGRDRARASAGRQEQGPAPGHRPRLRRPRQPRRPGAGHLAHRRQRRRPRHAAARRGDRGLVGAQDDLDDHPRPRWRPPWPACDPPCSRRGIPTIGGAIGGITVTPTVPDVDTGHRRPRHRRPVGGPDQRQRLRLRPEPVRQRIRHRPRPRRHERARRRRRRPAGRRGTRRAGARRPGRLLRSRATTSPSSPSTA